MIQNWLYKLGFKYKNMCKYVFIKRFKHLDIVKN